MRLVFSTLILLISIVISIESAFSEEWKQLKNNEITEALSEKDVVYKSQRNSSQSFYKNGVTGFVDGRPSQGFWRVTENQYCSQWPPSSAWSCYDVFLNSDGTQVRFRGADNTNWDGTYQ